MGWILSKTAEVNSAVIGFHSRFHRSVTWTKNIDLYNSAWFGHRTKNTVKIIPTEFLWNSKIEILFFLSECLFSRERHRQSSTVTNPDEEKKRCLDWTGTAYHARPQGDSSEGTGHLREETQWLCIQQPGSSHMFLSCRYHSDASFVNTVMTFSVHDCAIDTDNRHSLRKK